MRGVEFQENPSNDGRGTAQKIHFSRSKVSFIIHWSQKKKNPIDGLAPWMMGVVFQKILSNDKRDTAEKVHFWPRYVPFIIGTSQPNIYPWLNKHRE